MSKKRTLEGFFKPAGSVAVDAKHAVKEERQHQSSPASFSEHPTYPFPVPYLPDDLLASILSAPAVEGKEINNYPDLDLLYFQPYIPKQQERALFEFLRRELFFYRVEYKIRRGSVETQIRTPRYTTVFGVDETSRFTDDGALVDATSGTPIPKDRYRCKPRPIPHCLNELRKSAEATTHATFNFCLVNYYASGADSISYHSDDERFLGAEPAITSFSLGAKRDFYMKHKPIPPAAGPPPPEIPTVKLALASGDMVLMRGPTQAKWLHCIPKRKGGESERGRINITFRKAMVKGGTENYYNYNVGSGGAFKWDGKRGEMVAGVEAAEVIE